MGELQNIKEARMKTKQKTDGPGRFQKTVASPFLRRSIIENNLQKV